MRTELWDFNRLKFNPKRFFVLLLKIFARERFIDDFGIGLGATLNVAKPKKGSSVAIFGLGAVGLGVCSLFPIKNYVYFATIYCQFMQKK